MVHTKLPFPMLPGGQTEFLWQSQISCQTLLLSMFWSSGLRPGPESIPVGSLTACVLKHIIEADEKNLPRILVRRCLILVFACAPILRSPCPFRPS